MLRDWHFPFRPVGVLIAAGFALAVWSLWWATVGGVRAVEIESVAAPPGKHSIEPRAGGPDYNFAHVAGEVLCVDCHRAEVAHWNRHWRESGHGWGGYVLLTGQTATRYGEALGIAADQVTKNSLCVKCHATPQLDVHARVQPILGVSCEACHNPAGGEDGWLNAHAVYGPPGTSRHDESRNHFQQRIARSTAAGQLRGGDLYSLARRCYECHIIGGTLAEELVAAGHEAIGGQFSHLLEGLSEPKIRHNFHVDQGVNDEVSSLWTSSPWQSGRTSENRKRMIYVVGELARLETLLRHMIDHYESQADNDFVYEMAESVEASDELELALGGIDSLNSARLHKALSDVVEVFEEDEVPQDEEGWLVDALEIIADGEYEDLPEDPRAALTNLADVLRDLAGIISSGAGEELAELDLSDL